MKKAVCLMLVFAMAVICGLCVCAENDRPADYTISAGQGQYSVGDSVTVTLSVTAVKPIGRVSAVVAYDPAALTFVSGDGATDNNGTISIEQPSGLVSSAVINITFTAQKACQSAVSVTKCAVYDAFDEALELGSKNAMLVINEAVQTTETSETTTTATETEETTTQTTTVETDANGVPKQGVLIDLTVDQGSLIPPFMYSIHEYSLTVPYEVEKVEIEGKTASLQDHIWYTGNPECVVGRNVRTIEVTDIDGNKTVYTINITRLNKDAEQTTTATTAQQSQPEENTISANSKATAVSDSDKGSDIKNTLNPALIIVLIVLIVALVIVIIWIKSRFSKKDPDKAEKQTQKQRSKIKVSGSSTRNTKNSKNNRKK